MKKSPLRFVLILGGICITGALITQIFWVQKALQVKEANFDDAVALSLRRVVEQIDYSSTNTIATLDVIRKISPRNFQLNINDQIDCNVLEFYLRTELSYPNLDVDFNYSVFSVANDTPVFRRNVDLHERDRLYSVSTDLPIFKNEAYYAIVSFPKRSSYIGVKMTIWIFSSFILLIVVFFFFYTIFVILKQFRVVEMQKDFINNMAHEFKTPISTIAISSEVLSKPDIILQPERLRNYANIISSEVNRLRNQVDKLLQMAKIERDKIELHLEEINLHELISEVIPNFSLKLDDNQGRILYHLDACDHMIMADRVHLTNIIYNLLDNAVKYTEDMPEINIQTLNENGEIIFSVKDNGIGISQEFQQKVFDKFFRVPTGNIHNVKGFGLGLHYLRLVINAHNWKMKLESEKNHGSNFSIFIPCIKINSSDARSKAESAISGRRY
ncbi:MAG: HAMP domain-containing histidine kinase [Chitinophagales bacterium]|nr:HAMP domain-containing histidine kinase [Chitinophagales bacterium]